MTKMKNFLACMPSFIVLVTLLTFSQSFTCSESMYEDYLTHWNRSFTEEKKGPEYTIRYESYCRNREWVDDVNSQNLTYELDTYWKWMDKTESQREQFVSSKISLEPIVATAHPTDENLKKVSATLPPYVDFRESGDVSSIKSQGACGCCWAYTTAGAYESFLMLKGEQEYDLSEEYLLECTTKFTENVMNITGKPSNCSGALLSLVAALAWVNGIPLESAYPYIAFNYTGSIFPRTPGICDAKQTIMYARNPELIKYDIYYNSTSDQMKAIIVNGPIAGSIFANPGFQAYKGGVYSGCPQSFNESYSKVNHGVIIVGYDKDGNYIIKNSWDTTWGDKGFGVISKDRDCAISAVALQFTSSAAPGSGVLYNSPVSMNKPSSERHITASMLFFVVMLVMMVLSH